MRTADFVAEVRKNPVIAAVKDDESLGKALASSSGIIFVLYGDACTIADVVRRVKAAGKIAMVHVDRIVGLTAQPIVCDFIKEVTQADGIISTHPSLILRARELGLNTMLRFFMIDSIAFENVIRQARRDVQPDLIEVLPAVLMPEVYREIVRVSKVPVMAGGLLSDRRQVTSALKSGCVSVSTTNQDVWSA
ncbi:glycerol-3-phosphate responsive antiterminator [Olsenella sp. HMSC062G07]|uniref:glycerol-3-phosphate responsive antiterminator n=1 Tax=Olsenella sp. HMSC062G07 TaxID=1739330 RepID=UPI0008A10FEC|nr:glycerol-3-phosphate responsive antiterminator [Olsenella sp. HMSC062G07]OFK22406.1 antiterminator [Olsenella sp. HMSC062G07]